MKKAYSVIISSMREFSRVRAVTAYNRITRFRGHLLVAYVFVRFFISYDASFAVKYLDKSFLWVTKLQKVIVERVHPE